MKTLSNAGRLNLCFAGAWFISGAAFAAIPLPAGVCARTAEAAVQRWLANDVAKQESVGYRVISVREDFVAHRQWALVRSCVLSDKPMQAVLLPAGLLQVQLEASRVVVVHAGESVRIDALDGISSIVLRGEALESGAAGDEISVRVARWNDAVEAAPVIRCRVIATGEMEWKR